MQRRNSLLLTVFLKKIILFIMSKETKLLSVAEAAEKLGVSRWRVNQFIDEGRLPAQKVGRAFVILESDLQLVENRPTGRPPKQTTDAKASGTKRAHSRSKRQK